MYGMVNVGAPRKINGWNLQKWRRMENNVSLELADFEVPAASFQGEWVNTYPFMDPTNSWTPKNPCKNEGGFKKTQYMEAI